jgi:hypothetical protein
MEMLDLTRLTLDEFQRLVQPFEIAFQGRVKRCLSVHDTSRVVKAGVLDRAMKVCGALQHFRGYLMLYQPWVESE